MSNPIAFDVVILPSLEVRERCIEINLSLKSEIQPIQLNQKHTLPHISLCMGVCQRSDLEDLNKILEQIENEHLPVSIELPAIELHKNTMGAELSYLKVERRDALQRLHEVIMHRLESYTGIEATSSMLAGDPCDHTPTLDWISNYHKNSAFKKFDPHITLGYGRYTGEPYSARFLTKKLGLYQLGCHCTCQIDLRSI